VKRFLACERGGGVGRRRREFNGLPRSSVTGGILILDLQRRGDQMRVGCRVRELDVARAIDLRLHQQLGPLRIDDQPELRGAWLGAVGLAAGVEGLGGEPELPILARPEAEASFFRPPLIVEVPGRAAIPGNENPHGGGLLLGCAARADGERDFQVGLPGEVRGRRCSGR
jgi:hypothetical protein